MSQSPTSKRFADDDHIVRSIQDDKINIDLRPEVVVRTLFIITAFGVAILILQQLASFFVSLLVASFLAVAADPAVRWMQRRGMGRGGAVMTLLVGIILVFALVLSVFVPPVVEQGNKLAKKAPEYVDEMRSNEVLNRLDAKYDVVDRATKQLEQLPTTAGAKVGSAVSTVASGLFGAFTVMFMMILLLTGGGQLVRGTVTLFPRLAERRYWSLVQGAYTNIGAYVAGTLIIAVCAGAVMAISLLVLGIPFAGPLALWMLLFGIIPMIGATLGAVPAVMVTFLADDGGVVKGLVLIGIVIAYQQIENIIIQPSIQGRVVNLPPIIIFLSVLIGSQLLGVLGALIAVPFAGIVQIFIRQILEARGDVALDDVPPIAPEPPEAPDAPDDGGDDSASSTPV